MTITEFTFYFAMHIRSRINWTF